MSKLRKAAKDMPCQVRSPVCCNNRETTVLAHLNGAGLALKADDFTAGAWACATCHAWLDGLYARTHSRADRDVYHLEAVRRTQDELIRRGIVEVVIK